MQSSNLDAAQHFGHEMQNRGGQLRTLASLILKFMYPTGACNLKTKGLSLAQPSHASHRIKRGVAGACGGDHYFFQRFFIHAVHCSAEAHNIVGKLERLAFVILHVISVPERKKFV